MSVPDSFELILRDLQETMFDHCLPLEKWEMKEIEYTEPGKYRITGKPELIKPGDEWDNTGKSFIFSCRVEVPEKMKGKKLYLEIDIDGEALVYVNDKLLRGINERFVLIDNQALQFYDFKILATWNIHEAVRHYRLFKEEYPRHYFKTARLVVFNETIYNYCHLLETANEILQISERLEHSLVLQEAIEKSLREINFHIRGREEYLDSVKKAEKVLKDKIKELGKSPYPGSVFFAGHSHLDVAFKWPVGETIKKCQRTFSTALKLMEDYPGWVFAQSQAQLYKFARDYYPELFLKIKQMVSEGHWEIVGGMWVEADTNLSSGEALVRQILYGKRFFEKEFGLKPEVCWLPDCFGFNAQLPQILKKSGYKYFLTSKLLWNDTNEFPFNFFLWEGIDGSVIPSCLMTRGYGGKIEVSEVKKCLEGQKDKQNRTTLYLFGHGDGGGGVTSTMLKKLEDISQIRALPEVKTGRVEEYLKDVLSFDLPLWKGELYLEKHRGTYTSQAQLKKKNRESEFVYREAEIISSLCSILGDEIDIEGLQKGWEKILLNQFHDILPGSCIKDVVKDALKDYSEVLAEGKRVRNEALNLLSGRVNNNSEQILYVFNSLSFQRTTPVRIRTELFSNIFSRFNIPDKEERKEKVVILEDCDGKIFYGQFIEEEIVFTAELPPLGYKGFRFREIKSKKDFEFNQGNKTTSKAFQGKEDIYFLENCFFKLEVNKNGNLKRLYDKRLGREVLKGQGNLFQIFRDKSTYFDAWDLNISEEEKYQIDDVIALEVKEQGPVLSSLLLKKRFNNSIIEQEIIIYNHVPRIDFKTRVDWQERQMLLKVAFPVDILSEKARYDMAFGNIERSTHNNTSWDRAQFEVPAHKWADLSEYGYGVSLLNNCKYGYDIKGNVIRLTLLKGGIFPDPEADLGVHTFTYSLYPHPGDFRSGGTIEEAYSLNQPPLVMPVMQENTQKNLADWPEKFSFFKIDAPNVILETLKRAEDGCGYIMRLYETYGQRQKIKVTAFYPIKKVTECNLLEEDEKEVNCSSPQTFSFFIKPYEIKTFRINFNPGS